MNFQSLDLNRLQIFRAIVSAGNLTKAALFLNLPKSKVSRQLTALEEEIGTQLIFRSTRSLRLTPAGQELAEQALNHLAMLEQALERVVTTQDVVSGLIRISVPEDIGTQLMGGICQSFMRLYPKVKLDVHTGNQKVDLVRESFDLVLRMGPLKDSSLIQRKIGTLQLGVYFSPEFRAKQGRLLDPRELAQVPFLAFNAREGAIKFHRSDRSPGDKLVVKTQNYFTSNNFFVLRDLALRGMGAALMPVFIAEEYTQRGQLVTFSGDWKVEGVVVHLVMPKQKEVPVRVQKFIEHIRTQMLPYTS